MHSGALSFLGPEAERSSKALLKFSQMGSSQGFVGSGLASESLPHDHNNCVKTNMLKVI